MKIKSIIETTMLIQRSFQIGILIIRHLSTSSIQNRKIKRRLHKNKDMQGAPQLHTTPERIRTLIEDLGPTFIKFGQILADRPDIISERFRLELKKLQSSAEPLDDQVAVNLIKKELNCTDLSDVFLDFNPKAIASASIGQVYTAKLKTGEPIVVKIQRPNIEKKIKLDIFLLHRLSKKFVESYPEMASLNIVSLVSEFGENMKKELNYYNEASNIKRFQKMFEDMPSVHIPKVYLNYTTRRMITMERIYGFTPDNVEKLRNNGIDTKAVAYNGANAISRMIFEYGFFHADPHAGNIFITKNNVIVFIDFGMTGVLRPRDMGFLANFIIGLARRDPRVIAQSLLTLCNITIFDDLEDLEFDLSQILENHLSVPLNKIDLSKVVDDCIGVLIKYKLKVPSTIYMLVKALATIEHFAVQLDPHLSLYKITEPYARKIIFDKYKPRKIAESIYGTIQDYVKLVNQLPKDISEILYKLKEGTVIHQHELVNDEELTKVFQRIGSRLAYAVLLIGTFIGASILVVFGNYEGWMHTTLVIVLVLIIITAIGYMFRKK